MRPFACLAVVAFATAVPAMDISSDHYLITAKEDDGSTWVVVLDPNHQTGRVAAYRNNQWWVTFSVRPVHLGERGLFLDATQSAVFGPQANRWSPDSFLLSADDRDEQLSFDLFGNRMQVEIAIPLPSHKAVVALRGGNALTTLTAEGKGKRRSDATTPGVPPVPGMDDEEEVEAPDPHKPQIEDPPMPLPPEDRPDQLRKPASPDTF